MNSNISRITRTESGAYTWTETYNDEVNTYRTNDAGRGIWAQETVSFDAEGNRISRTKWTQIIGTRQFNLCVKSASARRARVAAFLNGTYWN